MSRPAFRAVVLAAGMGSRLAPLTGGLPKCLLEVGPRGVGDPRPVTLLERHLELLLAAGAEDLVVVVGHQHAAVQERLERWSGLVRWVVNDTPEMSTSGSLHSLRFALRACPFLGDGSAPLLFMDADIVYPRMALERLLRADRGSSLLVAAGGRRSSEAVLVWGERRRPRFIGKGLGAELVAGAPCVGEATGMVALAPEDQPLARRLVDWFVGDPDAPEGSLERRGFGGARQGTEHEELTQRLMQLGRMECVTLERETPFSEVDTPEDYRRIRAEIYPRVLRCDARASAAHPHRVAEGEPAHR